MALGRSTTNPLWGEGLKKLNLGEALQTDLGARQTNSMKRYRTPTQGKARQAKCEGHRKLTMEGRMGVTVTDSNYFLHQPDSETCSVKKKTINWSFFILRFVHESVTSLK